MKISNFWYVVIFSVLSSLLTGTIMLWSFSKLNFESSSFENFALSKKTDNRLCVSVKSEDEIIYGKFALKHMLSAPLKRVHKDVLIVRNIDGYEAISADSKNRLWSYPNNQFYDGFINNTVINWKMFFADRSNDGKSLVLSALDIFNGTELWKKTLIDTGFQGKTKRVVVLSNNDELYVISYKEEFIGGCEEGSCEGLEQEIRNVMAGDVNYVFKINTENGSVIWKKRFLNNEPISLYNEIDKAYFENNQLKFLIHVPDVVPQINYELSFDLTNGAMIKKNIE